ncbi:MAG: hypothetical protein A2Y33_11470 [Spirochaetes bacterium GWF1_51_8]|nr:MAG: hypothetical protein A2Y33_11470 [Spirochaetes bacterium GWF1_51_8]
MKLYILALLLISGFAYAGHEDECMEIKSKKGEGTYVMTSAGFSIYIDPKNEYVDMFENNLMIKVAEGTLNIDKFSLTQDWKEAKSMMNDDFKNVVYNGHAPKKDSSLKVLKTDTSKLNGMECILKEYTYQSSDGLWKGTIVLFKTPKGVYQMKYDRPEDIYIQFIDKIAAVMKTAKPISEN